MLRPAWPSRLSPNGRVFDVSGLAHRHIVSVLTREAAARGFDKPCILDAGCGDGALLALVAATLPGILSGFDSADYGLQPSGKIGSLASDNAEIRTTNPDGSWPFSDREFDIVVSNQVIEHVVDLETFCAENARVLRPGGFGVHAFPLKHILLEPHMLLPLVHWVRDHELRTWLITRLSALGLGRYRSHAPTGMSLEDFGRSLADYCRTFTTYRTWRQVCDEFHRHGFRVTYGHTSTLAQRGLWRLAGRERPCRVLPPALEAAIFPLVRAFVSCTLIVHKAQEFRPEDYQPQMRA